MKIINVFIVLTILSFNTAVAQFYVAPHGNDNNPGTKEQPVASLSGAKNLVLNFKNNNLISAPITVIVMDGNYEMQEPLIFYSEDSGTKEYEIIYKAAENANPVFSGGKKLKNIVVNNDGIWEIEVPESVYYNWRFEQLYVNGKRATLARTPNKGFLKIGEIKQHVWVKGTGRIAEKALQIISFDKEYFEFLSQITDEEKDIVRFKAYHKWDFTLRFIDKIDKDSLQIYTSGKGMKPWNPLKKGGRIVFENYRAALDEAGEWYLAKNGTLYYYPREGETPKNTEIIAPVLENLITIKGDALNNEFIENIQFEGLSFAHSHYKMPRTGSEPNQAAALINAAIMVEGARNVHFKNCEISQTGQHALWFGKGCSYNLVEKCYLSNLGGGGIYLGGFNPLEGVEHTSNIKLHNNIIQSGGKEFPSSVGVWVGHSSDCEISNNDIGNFYYSGISVGWIWGYANSLAKRNKIIGNRIHHIGWDLLSDMAGVYTLGKSEGTVISNNVVHHVHSHSYGGWGLYTDEGSSGILMENNLVYSTKTGGFHQHYGKNNVIRNNIFAFAKRFQAQCTRVEKHRSFNFENNIILFNEGVVLKGAWEKVDIEMDHNLYWNSKENLYSFNDKSFTEWQKTGHDTNSYIAKPHFKDPDNFDFRFKNKKSIKKIDFKPFDYETVGVYGSEAWIKKAQLPEYLLREFDERVIKNMKMDINRD